MMKRLLFIAAMALLMPVVAGAVIFETYQGKVVGVVVCVKEVISALESIIDELPKS